MTLALSPFPSATSIVDALARGATTAEAVVEASLERIAACEPMIHAWQVLDAEGALRRAHALDRAWAGGAARGALCGVPLAIKDIIDTADLPTAYGSKIYRDAQPVEDAWCVSKVRSVDGVVMGKTVTTEFAYFAPGPTANPCDVEHTPGGSSSGSAAAVADGMVPLAFGTQTAASLIRPASYCGVFGLKPTHGTVSLEGIKPFASSLDTLGWLARSADDLELMRCALLDERYVPLEAMSPTSLRLIATRTHEWATIDEDGAAAWAGALSRVSRGGRSARVVDLPAELADLFDAHKTVMAYEAARSLAPELRDHREHMSSQIVGLLETGATIDETAYRNALTFAKLGRRMMADLMRDADALLIPAAPGEAPKGLAATGDPAFSRVWTLLGLPCVSVPGMTGAKGLPIGTQLVGHPGRERDLLHAAACMHRLLGPEGIDARG